MKDKLPKVTFGFVNCNRLHYLRSCLESFLMCTEDYTNKEIIVVDNASTEDGTDEYLEELKNRGFAVFRQRVRDPSNEYAKALNIIAENATGKYVAPIPADIQFVVKGQWLQEYVNFLEEYEETTGCISFDAQRRIRNASGQYSNMLGSTGFKFLYHFNRNPVMGAMNCMVTKKMLDMVYPWETENVSHEGGEDSETKMLKKIETIFREKGFRKFYSAPAIPVAVGIFNEQGGNARVRGNRRFGNYWPPPEDDKGVSYYEIHSFERVMEEFGETTGPVAIEDIAEANGWKLPIDEFGAWIKLKDSPDIKSVEI
jgi:glycosyltransferase involved in cell wall biosynthesis